MQTSITVSGLQLYAFHGLFSEEQRLGQKFTFDLRAELSARGTHGADDLSGSLRYDALVEHTVSTAQSSRFQTLEALAEQLARSLLAAYPQLSRIVVSVAKLSPPIPYTVSQVAVEVALAREDLEAGRAQGS